MKKLIVTSILAISFITANASQIVERTIFNDTITKNEVKTTAETYPVIAVEDEDEPFEFNTEDYLPINFNAYVGLYEDYGVVEEEDEVFDFDTKKYLPVGFNAKLKLDTIVEINIEEEDEAFDFDTKMYLPKGFKATKVNEYSNEL